MVRFELDDATRLALLPHHRAFQATIAVMAHKLLDTPLADDKPRGIGKYEGGVVVAGRELCIRANNVMDDWKLATEPMREEQALAQAIGIVSRNFNQTGKSALLQPPPSGLSDPLRSFFEPVMPKGYQF